MAPASPVLLVAVLMLATVIQARKPGGHTGVRDGRAIPGVPGQDYPTFAIVPRTGFSCFGRTAGFHSDPASRCQAFHICPGQGPGVPQSFLCPNGTLFNARVNTCDWWNKVRCQDENFEQFPDSRVQTTPNYRLVMTSENYRYNDDLQDSQFVSPQTERIILDNQVTESRVNFRRTNGFANSNQINTIPFRSEFKNPQFANSLNDRPIGIEMSSPAENRYLSNANPATEVSIRPRVRYVKKSFRTSSDKSFHSLNPIVQVARDSSLLSTFFDPSEERTTDSSASRIRKPTQRYAVQGVLPQYDNSLSQINPNRLSSRDDSFQPAREDKRFDPNVGSGPSNFQPSQDQGGMVVGNSNDQTSGTILDPDLNIDEVTQTEKQLNSLFNPINNQDPNISQDKSFENGQNIPSNSPTDTMGLDQGTFLTETGSSPNDGNVDSPQTVRVSSGYSFTPVDMNTNNNNIPKRFRVSSSYNTQEQFPKTNSGARIEIKGIRILGTPEISVGVQEVEQANTNQDGGSSNNFGIVDNEEVKFVNKFIATEADLPKPSSEGSVSFSSENEINNPQTESPQDADSSQEADLPKPSSPAEGSVSFSSGNEINNPQTESFQDADSSQEADSSTDSLPTNEQPDNDPLAAFFPGAVIMESLNSPTSSTESDIESELINIFGGSTLVDNKTDNQSSGVDSAQQPQSTLTIPTTQEPTPAQFNPSSDSSIVNDTSSVVENNVETTTLSTDTNDTSNTPLKSPEVVNGALNFNFNFGGNSVDTAPGGNVQTNEEPIYYGQVTPLSGGSVQNNRLNTLKPSDQAYFPNLNIRGHFITNAPIDTNTVRFQYNRTYQTPGVLAPVNPPMVEGQYHSTFSEGVSTTNSQSATFTPTSPKGTQRISGNNPPLTVTVNRQYVPAFGYFEPFGGYPQRPYQGIYQNNAFAGEIFTPNYQSALPTPSPPNSVRDNYSQNGAGFRPNIPSFGSTLNPTQSPQVPQGNDLGNYQQKVLGNAFFLGRKPAFENSHLALPVFPPQSIFYSTYPNFRVTPKPTTTAGSSSTQPPVNFQQPSQSKSINTPSMDQNFETIVKESIGSIGYEGTTPQTDFSSTVSPTPFSFGQSDNGGISAFSPGSTITGNQPRVETYSSMGASGQFGPSTSRPSTDFNQNPITNFQSSQENPGFQSTGGFPSTSTFVSPSQAPSSAFPPPYPDGQTNQTGFIPNSSFPPTGETYSSIGSSLGASGQFGPSTPRTDLNQNPITNFQFFQEIPGFQSNGGFPSTSNFVRPSQAPSSAFPPSYPDGQTNLTGFIPNSPFPPSSDGGQLSTTEVSPSAANGNSEKSTFRIVYPSGPGEIATTIQDTSGAKSTSSLPNVTPSSIGNSGLSSTVGNTDAYNIPADVSIATPKPFSPFGPQQQYLPPQLHPTILPHYYQAGRQLFTPMDLFDINNLPRPSAITISQINSADIVRSISFSFDNSEDREAFENARAKGWFER